MTPFDHRPLLDVDPDPEPIECPDCGGRGYTGRYTGHGVVDITCPRCGGEGVTEDGDDW